MRKILIIILFLVPLILEAQEGINNADNQLYSRAIELYNKGKFGSASYLFSTYIDENNNINSSEYIASKYYYAVCQMNMDRSDAMILMKDFVKSFPNSIYSSEAKQRLAYSTFSNKDFVHSLEYFKDVDERSLVGEMKSEFLLKRGYCYMVNNKEKEAANDFYSIEASQSKYKPYADFYYANISFRNKKYQTALELYDKLKNNRKFSRIVPYYIIQVYYMQKRYNDVVNNGVKYYEITNEERKVVLSRIIANSYFNLEKYKEAEHYYEFYFSKVGDVEKIDNYEYGYCLYMLGKYKEAINLLSKVGGEVDVLVQLASYCMADCYIKVGDKESARKALQIAASVDFDEEVKEIALFNSAKISYELSYSPFNETLNSFDQYIESYPNSRRNDEAYDYLVEVYMKTKDYKASLKSMDKIRIKTLKIKKAYQRISYYMGIQLYNAGEYSAAISYFNKSLTYKEYDNIIAANCVYWKGEAYYELNDFKRSIDELNQFLLTPGSSLTDNYSRAYYALGYSYYKHKEYNRSIENFKSFELQNPDKSSLLLSDSRYIIIDYYLYAGDYEACISYCNKIILDESSNVDFAYLKKAKALGLMGRIDEQLESLNMILQNFKNSEYYDEACYEAGNVAMTLEKNIVAKENYEKIISKKKIFKYDAMAKLQLALIAYNEKNLDESERLYKSVISDYKSTDYAVLAKSGLKNVMVEDNKVDNYYNYISEKGIQTDKDNLAKDSLSYAAAEKLYMDNNLKDAIISLESYLNLFPRGDFSLTANYYLADSYYRSNMKDKSLLYYENILSKDNNTFTLEAAKRASEINYANKEYNKAIVQYGLIIKMSDTDVDKLHAEYKMIEAYFNVNDFKSAIINGERIINSSLDIESRIKIHMILAKAYKETGKEDEAIRHYRIVAKNMNSSDGASAKYIVCKYLFDKGNYIDSEKEINEFMNSESTQYKFLAKSFMLLSDIFLKKDDKFQAKYTLMSIIENYPEKNDGIIKEAKEKLLYLQDKEENKEDSIKIKNAEQKTRIENNDLEHYRKSMEESDKIMKANKTKAKEFLNEMESSEIE